MILKNRQQISKLRPKTIEFRTKPQKYPTTLTINQIECYNILHIFHSLRQAKSYAAKISGQIYTQIDADAQVVYSKGICIVNRTGIYAVIRN
jgi:hypothetical protein